MIKEGIEVERQELDVCYGLDIKGSQMLICHGIGCMQCCFWKVVTPLRGGAQLEEVRSLVACPQGTTGT